MWQTLLVKFYTAIEIMVKSCLRVEALIRNSQRTAGIAVRCMSPSLIDLLGRTLRPHRSGEGFLARTNMQAATETRRVVDADSCHHADLEAYANAHGRFRSCAICRKRWKAAPRGAVGTEVWVEHGFKPLPGSYSGSSRQSSHAAAQQHGSVGPAAPVVNVSSRVANAPARTPTSPMAEEMSTLLRDAHRQQQLDMKEMHRQQQEELRQTAQQIQAQQQNLDTATQLQQSQATRLDQLGNHMASQFTAMQEALTLQLSEQPDRPRKTRPATVLPEQQPVQGVYATESGVSQPARYKAPPPPASLTAQVPPPPSRPASSTSIASTGSWVMPQETFQQQTAVIQNLEPQPPQFHGVPQMHSLGTPHVSGDEAAATTLEEQDELSDLESDLVGPPQFS